MRPALFPVDQWLQRQPRPDAQRSGGHEQACAGSAEDLTTVGGGWAGQGGPGDAAARRVCGAPRQEPSVGTGPTGGDRDTGAERESAGRKAEAQEAEEGKPQEQQQPAPNASKLYFPAMQTADGAQFLVEHGGCPDRALLLCWARYEMGGPCLAAYRGDTVVAVGEVDDGATWWLDTEEHPERRQLRRVPLPTWPMPDTMGGYTDLRVYRRVEGAGGGRE